VNAQKHNWRVFSPNLAKPHLSFAPALQDQADQLHREATASTCKPEPPKTKSKQQETGQSVLAPTVSSDSLDMFRALTVVQQIMIELKGAVSEEAKIFAITKTVINLMKENAK
jgi:hypothetical protein